MPRETYCETLPRSPVGERISRRAGIAPCAARYLPFRLRGGGRQLEHAQGIHGHKHPKYHLSAFNTLYHSRSHNKSVPAARTAVSPCRCVSRTDLSCARPRGVANERAAVRRRRCQITSPPSQPAARWPSPWRWQAFLRGRVSRVLAARRWRAQRRGRRSRRRRSGCS